MMENNLDGGTLSEVIMLRQAGFPGGSDGKESVCNAGNPGSVPESGRSLGEGNGYPLQYSCLENAMDRDAWQAAVHRVALSRPQLSDFTFTFHFHAMEKETATHSSILAWRIPMDRGAWWAAVHEVAKSQIRLKWLSTQA